MLAIVAILIIENVFSQQAPTKNRVKRLYAKPFPVKCIVIQKSCPSQINIGNIGKQKDSVMNIEQVLQGKLVCLMPCKPTPFKNCLENKIQFVNQKNEPLRNMVLSSNCGLISLDSLGNFDATTLKTGSRDSIEFSYVGYTKTKMSIVDFIKRKTIILKEKVDDLQEVLITSDYGGKRCRGCGFRICWIHPSPKLITKSEVKPNKFQIYPNPAKANQLLNLTIQDQGNYLLQFIATNGQIIFQKNVSVNSKNQSISLNAPAIQANQMIFVQLLNTQTKTKQSQTIFLIP